MDKSRNKLCNVALMTAAGVGLLLLVVAKRRHIFSYFKTEKNLLKYKRIEVVQTVNDCHRVITQLKKHCDKLKVLGFDCEWVTMGGTRRPVALLQLSSGDGLCALFRLCCLKQIPKSLRDILEDDNIVKVGIAPQGDAQKLAYDYGVAVASTFDLRFLAALTGKRPEGLAKMSKSILDVDLVKHWRLVCSDWEAKDLNEKQLEYAANDALVAVEIFKKLSKDVIPLKGFWQNNSDFEHIRHKLEPFYEVNFKDGLITDPSMEKAWKTNLKVKSDQRDVKKSQSRGMSTISKALYDNCLLEAPDGELLCTIDRRKANWYLDQSLGIEVLTEPFTVRLNFEPAGRAVGEVGKYYQSPKENKCVVCGQKESFMRKNVIPREYRKHFPEVLKSHTSHDVLLLCLNCHRLSNISDLKIRHKLSEMCNAPLTSEGSHNSEEFQKLRQVKSAARALLKCKNQIPEERRKNLESIVLQYFNKETTDINYDLLLEASEIETKESNKNYSQHGEKVVKKFQTELGGLLQLEKIWREHFINTMQPKYLPPLWNVNHSADRLEIKAIEGRVKQEDLKASGITWAK